MNKGIKMICLGLVLNGILLLGRKYEILPDFIEGIFTGLVLVFIFGGTFMEICGDNKIKEIKFNLGNKLLKK